jgi:hypothetical protein
MASAMGTAWAVSGPAPGQTSFRSWVLALWCQDGVQGVAAQDLALGTHGRYREGLSVMVDHDGRVVGPQDMVLLLRPVLKGLLAMTLHEGCALSAFGCLLWV